MIYVSKIAPLFFLPLGLALCLLVAGLVTRRRVIVLAAMLLLIVSSTPRCSVAIAHYVEGEAVRKPIDSIAAADAIVVLSTGRIVAPGPQPVSEWTDADRFFAGVELWRAGKAPRVIFTGGTAPWDAGPLEGDVLAQTARSMGVPENAALTTPAVYNTAEEAVAVANRLASNSAGRHHIILVTSAFHMPRAQLLFERKGMTVTPFPVDFAGITRGSVLDWLPNAGALAQTHMAVRELYGRAYYRLLAR